MNKDKWISIAKGAGIAGAGAFLTYASQAITSVDFGQMGPIVAALLAVGVNVVRKWAEKTEEK